MNTSKPDIVVKWIDRYSRDDKSIWTIQCPNGEARWGRCRFVFDPNVKEYDWLVARNDIPEILHKEILQCPRKNTLLFTSEPSSITRYGKAFAAQFGHVLTSQEEWILPHPNAIRSQTGNVWHYLKGNTKTYDDLVKEKPPQKNHLMSTVCSAKQMGHTMHAKRYEFTQRLKREIPELVVFGRGIQYIEKKSDALDSYQFHLAIENHIAPHHWTEKLADPLLGYCVPIYCGCTNVYDYFPEDSIVQIDINDLEGSVKTIRRILTTEGEYERRLDAVIEARRRVLEEHNLPAMLSRIIENAEPAAADAERGVIYTRRIMRLRRPDEFVRFAGWRVSNFLQNLKQRIQFALQSQNSTSTSVTEG